MFCIVERAESLEKGGGQYRLTSLRGFNTAEADDGAESVLMRWVERMENGNVRIWYWRVRWANPDRCSSMMVVLTNQVAPSDIEGGTLFE